MEKDRESSRRISPPAPSVPSSMPEPVNEHEIRVFAMKRSGHHAVVTWLIGHFPGPVYFLNNCSFLSRTEFCSTRVGQFRREDHFSGRVSIFCDRGRVERVVEHISKTELVDRPQERLFKMVDGEQKCLIEREAAAARDAYIFNLEDFDLSQIDSVPFAAARRGESRREHNVIVLRDPYNWLASRLKGNFPVNDCVLEAWKSQAREALGRSQQLDNPLLVNYNRWFSDDEYRHSLSRQLHLTPTDATFDYMPDFGGGSSFEGFAYQNRAHEMNVLERWKVFANDAAYRKFFADPELVELGQELFGMSPLEAGG